MSASSRDSKRRILEGVYEENRRIDDARAASVRRRQSPTNDRPGWPRVLATATLIVVVGIVAVLAQVAGSSGDLSASAAAIRPVAGQVVPSNPLNDPTRLEVLPENVAGRKYIGNTEIPIASLFDLSVKTIVIDAGHGGRDPGAVGNDGLTEAEITLDVARLLKQRLEQSHNYRILLTRTDDSFMSLRERVRFANNYDADLFISLHVNYLPVEPVTSIETYYFGTETDSHTLRLAERENQNSGFNVAEFNEMLQNVGRTMKAQESEEVARSIQRSLYRNISQINQQVSDWGVKSAPFVVLLGVEAPAVLAEIAVLSNRAEEAKLAQPEYREMLAGFLEEGITQYLNKRTTGSNLISAIP